MSERVSNVVVVVVDGGDDRQVRALRPGRVIALPSGLWVLDQVQPVAVVLDPSPDRVPGPGDSRVHRVVSWGRLPPPPHLAGVDQGEPASVCADAQALWVQQHPGGPLLRVGIDGVEASVWTRGRRLTAAAGASAWCTAGPRRQELVRGAGARPLDAAGGDAAGGEGGLAMGSDWLLRADADGRVQKVFTDAPVRSVRTTEQAVWVQLDVAPFSLRHLGVGTYEVSWSNRWVPLPLEGNLPNQVQAASGQRQAPDAPVRPVEGDGTWHGYPYEPRGQDVAAAGHLWRLGWREPAPGDAGAEEDAGGVGVHRAARRAGCTLATAFDPDHAYEQGARPVCTIELAVRGVQAVASAGQHLVVLAHCDAELEGAPAHRTGPHVLALNPRGGTAGEPGGEQVRVWLSPHEVDISAFCWPLRPEPLDADSYARQVLADWGGLDTFWHGEDGVRPLAQGMSGSRVRLVGQWPHTHLECTFDFAPYPGLRLRRRVPLFDELGAIAHPEDAEIGLMEDLETGNPPPADRARDGVLDV
ncbi:hypothetical protein [Kineococcus arenarius]|uniref:hypothetical protein n=1 Tax=Kineococcus sp. SYSU DK007 TaxID=3383128 RepID=UPI003D7D858D